jgi:hypothetical protein
MRRAILLEFEIDRYALRERSEQEAKRLAG